MHHVHGDIIMFSKMLLFYGESRAVNEVDEE